MYSYIKGTLEEVKEGEIVVDNHGIGYQILAPLDIADHLPAVGTEVKIYTYLHVKEDGISLFGFPTKDSLSLFCLLLKVNGIGPKAAMGILSSLSADELRFAVLAGDAKAIAKAPGVGAKSAQRIILELKDKMHLEDILPDQAKAEGSPPVEAGTDTVKSEALAALVALGYSSSEALSAIAKTGRKEGDSVETVLKAALKQMAFL